MKHIFFKYAVLAAIFSLSILTPFSILAQDSAGVKVESAVVCKDIVNRDAVEAGTSFPAATSKLYCLSKIVGIQNASEVVHAWYFGDTERARVSLAVNPPVWRTYSSKIIQAHETGAWRVEILDAAGNLLETIRFEITP